MPSRDVVTCFVLSFFLAAGCGRRLPTTPTPLLDGTWTGSIVHSLAGTGTMVLTMSQVGVGVTGTWSADFAGDAYDRRGSAGGTVHGPQLALFLTPETPLNCGPGLGLSGTLALDGTVAGDRVTGTYVTLTCDGAEDGSVDVMRAN